MDAERLGEAVSLAHDVVVNWPPKQVRLSHMSLGGGWGGGGGVAHEGDTTLHHATHPYMGMHGLH